MGNRTLGGPAGSEHHVRGVELQRARAHERRVHPPHFAFEGEPYVRNVLTGTNGLFMQSPEWTLYQGTCQLSPPGVVDHINVFLSISEETENGQPAKLAQFDSIVVRPIQCSAAIPPCATDMP